VTKSQLDFKSIQELMTYIDSKDQNKKQYDVLRLVGNDIDATKLIIKYKLNLSDIDYSKDSYQFFKLLCWPKRKSYIVGPPSQYGNILRRFNIKGQKVEISSIQKNFDHNFASKMAETLNRNNEYVVLDIETTGLNSLTDDIIQICIYRNDDDYFCKYLPLTKKSTNTAYEINKISDDDLKNATHITQEDVNYIIDKFDLKNKIVAIWTGENLFDRTFLETYFLEHDLTGLENIKFFNARKLLNNFPELGFKYAPKDKIASLYGINIENAHNALEDCIMQHTITENLLNKNISPLLKKEYEDLLQAIKYSFDCKMIKFNAGILYDKMCNSLITQNGPVLNDYDCPHRTRGSEWIDIHHIDEKEIDDIATRTNIANKIQDKEELERLKIYNKKERLVYATKVEHFILHCLLDYIRKCPSGGPHWTFGDIVKMQIGKFEKGSKEYNIQQKQQSFFSLISFDEIIKIYADILNYNSANLDFCIFSFYKLNTYEYDEEKLNEIKEKIKALLK
jgi:DNA polymerase III epsilon subunit-like protein